MIRDLIFMCLLIWLGIFTGLAMAIGVSMGLCWQQFVLNGIGLFPVWTYYKKRLSK